VNKLYYDYQPDGSQRPVWMCVPFDQSNVVDEYTPMYVNIEKYEPIFIGDFDDSVRRCSVLLQEIVVGRNNNEIGIKLIDIKNRIGDLSVIEEMIMLVSDVTEIIACSKNMF
jgi:hypothetical protein